VGGVERWEWVGNECERKNGCGGITWAGIGGEQERIDSGVSVTATHS
jgi:hypothetical protein